MSKTMKICIGAGVTILIVAAVILGVLLAAYPLGVSSTPATTMPVSPVTEDVTTGLSAEPISSSEQISLKAFATTSTDESGEEVSSVTLTATISPAEAAEFVKCDWTLAWEQAPINGANPVENYISMTVPEDGSDLRTFIFRYDANPSRTQVFSAGSGVVGVNNGRGEVYRNVKTGQTQEIVIYAIGDVPKRVEAGVYSMSGANAQLIAGAHVGQPEKRRIDFSAFVQEMYADAGTSVSDLDFYNATVAMLSADSDLRLTSRIDAAAVLENLMLWYEYEVTVPANGSIVNTVTAPLMPDIPSENTGKWSFDYLLSPGQRWADFRAITINIQTPFCLESSTLNFSKTQSGYTFSKSRELLDLQAVIRYTW